MELPLPPACVSAAGMAESTMSRIALIAKRRPAPMGSRSERDWLLIWD
jgi:hypothetical protein